MQELNYLFKVELRMFWMNCHIMLTKLLPRKPILAVLSLYGGWPVWGGCVNSKQKSAELCDIPDTPF